MSDPVGDALKFWGTIMLAFTAAAGVGIYHVASNHLAEKHENQVAQVLGTRAHEALDARSLKPLSIEKFKKDAECGTVLGYGSSFAAEGSDGKVVRGKICSDPGHESVIVFKP
jgi:hypothetical protein